MYCARDLSAADAWRMRDSLSSGGKEGRGAFADCFAISATESVSNGAKKAGEQMSGCASSNLGVLSVKHREYRFAVHRGASGKHAGTGLKGRAGQCLRSFD